jgi:hypothetical protein
MKKCISILLVTLLLFACILVEPQGVDASTKADVSSAKIAINIEMCKQLR